MLSDVSQKRWEAVVFVPGFTVALCEVFAAAAAPRETKPSSGISAFRRGTFLEVFLLLHL